MNWANALAIAEKGFETWAAKDHNRKWVRKIDGTPIKNDLLVNIATAFAEAHVQPAPIAGLEPVAWRSPTDVPSIELGSSRELILAVYRKHSGKVYSFAAEYLNGYRLRYDYGCPKDKGGVCDGCEEDGCPTTGWHYVDGAEDDGCTYHALSLDEGDEIKGWREVPRWGEDQYTAAQLEAHAAEQVRPLVEAAAGLIESVIRDSENGNGISDLTMSLLSDAAAAIRARGQV